MTKQYAERTRTKYRSLLFYNVNKIRKKILNGTATFGNKG